MTPQRAFTGRGDNILDLKIGFLPASLVLLHSGPLRFCKASNKGLWCLRSPDAGQRIGLL